MANFSDFVKNESKEKYTSNSNKEERQVDKDNLEGSLKKVSGLDFETSDGDRLSPLYDIHRERYVVYWTL